MRYILSIMLFLAMAGSVWAGEKVQVDEMTHMYYIGFADGIKMGLAMYGETPIEEALHKHDAFGYLSGEAKIVSGVTDIDPILLLRRRECE